MAFVVDVALSRDGLAEMRSNADPTRGLGERYLAPTLDMRVRHQLLCALRDGGWDGLASVVRPLRRRAYEGVYQWLCEHALSVRPFPSQEETEQAATLIAEHAYRHFLTGDAEMNFAALCFRLSMQSESEQQRTVPLAEIIS